jgi:flagellar L-ring protein precursor FlgH
MQRALQLLFALALVFGLGACSFMVPRVEVEDHPERTPVQAPVQTPTNGAIFQTASYRPLFEDHRARLVGDTLVVQIIEKVSASQKSTSSIAKSSDISAGITALPGISPKAFARAGIGANSANTFDGKGATENSNDFSGTITVTVREVLPNGHLIVAGEKQIGVNANVDVLRFSGQVDPRSIQPGNAVQSTQIANVRLEHRGRGAQADAQQVGWLQRVFMSVMSPI